MSFDIVRYDGEGREIARFPWSEDEESRVEHANSLINSTKTTWKGTTVKPKHMRFMVCVNRGESLPPKGKVFDAEKMIFRAQTDAERAIKDPDVLKTGFKFGDDGMLVEKTPEEKIADKEVSLESLKSAETKRIQSETTFAMVQDSPVILMICESLVELAGAGIEKMPATLAIRELLTRFNLPMARALKEIKSSKNYTAAAKVKLEDYLHGPTDKTRTSR